MHVMSYIGLSDLIFCSRYFFPFTFVSTVTPSSEIHRELNNLKLKTGWYWEKLSNINATIP